MAATIYPYRQALNESLKDLVLTYGAPAINSALAAIIRPVGDTKIPVFNDTNIVIGDKLDISEPTLCIVGLDDPNPPNCIGSGLFETALRTDIRVKTPWVSTDDFPEDFEYFGTTVRDNLFDLFTSQTNFEITPVNPDASHPLPAGASFLYCLPVWWKAQTWPIKSAEGRTRCYGWRLVHQANYQWYHDRALPIGG